VREQYNRIREIWRDAGIPYEWDKGIDPQVSIEKGKILPESAKKEHERQKELGWDVEGNIT
jgi:hypothetical protein